MDLNISLPAHGWQVRPYQEKFWNYLINGGKRAMVVWHRRAGKDDICLHYMAVAAMRRKGNYVYCLPEFNQGRRAIWDSVNPHTGMRRIDEAFPREMRESTNDQMMRLRMVNGSTIQIIGSDAYDAVVGSSFAGIVMSEFALSNPAAWSYFRPIVTENDGFAIFITTPRGRNHAYDMLNYARQTRGWFAELLTAHDTKAVSEDVLAEALAEYQKLHGDDFGRAIFAQEYECDFQSAVIGSFYGADMARVRNEGRVLDIDAIRDQPVHRVYDLGISDSTSIWFWQKAPSGQLLILDHYESAGVGLEHYRDKIEEIYKERGWQHGTDWVPHDSKVRELGTGRSRVETMQQLGLAPMLVPNATVQDGINAVRRTLPLCVFHPRCETGMAHLEQYRREWSEERKCFLPNPVHDFTSHSADSFRYLSLAWRPLVQAKPEFKPSGWYAPSPDDRTQRRGMRL